MRIRARDCAILLMRAALATAVAGCSDVGLVGVLGPCDAGPELCGDGVDNDCNGVVDEPACETPAAPTWGAYAAGLDVPECPEAPVLTVDTTEDQRDGGADIAERAEAGPELSLTEALRLAHNRAGPDTIRFDGEVFPAREPGTIQMGTDSLMGGTMLRVEQVCIDARGRGVVVDWGDPLDSRPSAVWSLGPGSLQVGLVMLHVPWQQSAFDSQIAGCRYHQDGTEALHGPEPEVASLGGESVFGPGNAMAVQGTIEARGTDPNITVRDNYYGLDPVTRRRFQVEWRLDFFSASGDATALVTNNVIAARLVSLRNGQSGSRATFEDNFIGVDRTGTPLGDELRGPRVDSFGIPTTFGPGNVIRNTTVAVEIDPSAQVQITRNRIHDNGTAIRYQPPGSPVPVPRIGEVTEDRVTGECDVSGTVEVFSDEGDQGETFVGEASCDPSAGFTLSLPEPIPSGLNATATLTDEQMRTSPFSEPAPAP
jgi:hypothetical protein